MYVGSTCSHCMMSKSALSQACACVRVCLGVRNGGRRCLIPVYASIGKCELDA